MVAFFNKSNSTALLVIAAVLVAAALYTYHVVSQHSRENATLSPAVQALQNPPDQTPYTDMEGNPLGLTGYVGTVLVVSTWASWCPSCVDSLKELSTLAQDYQSSDVKILAINRSDPDNIAKAFLKKYGISEAVQLVLDKDDRFFKSVDGYTMPETVIYDTDGNLVFHKHGVTSVAEMKLQIDRALAETASP